jgi:hypothetical protein
MKKVAKVLGMSSKKAAPKMEEMMPTESPVAEIPDEDVTRLNAAREQARHKKAGRMSTLLTDDGQYLGN